VNASSCLIVCMSAIIAVFLDLVCYDHKVA